MKLPWYVLPRPSIGNIMPLLGKNVANTIGPFILIPKHVYKDLKSESPSQYNVALLIHEETHRTRQKNIGLLKFAVKYLADPKFRFNEELIAVKEAMRHLKKNKMPFDFDRKAKILSSYLYLWPVSKEYAKEELEKIWNEID